MGAEDVEVDEGALSDFVVVEVDGVVVAAGALSDFSAAAGFESLAAAERSDDERESVR